MSASSVVGSAVAYASPAPLSSLRGTATGTGGAQTLFSFIASQSGLWAVAVRDLTTTTNFSYRLVAVSPAGADTLVSATALTGIVDTGITTSVAGSAYQITATLGNSISWTATKLA